MGKRNNNNGGLGVMEQALTDAGLAEVKAEPIESQRIGGLTVDETHAMLTAGIDLTKSDKDFAQGVLSAQRVALDGRKASVTIGLYILGLEKLAADAANAALVILANAAGVECPKDGTLRAKLAQIFWHGETDAFKPTGADGKGQSNAEKRLSYYVAQARETLPNADESTKAIVDANMKKAQDEGMATAGIPEAPKGEAEAKPEVPRSAKGVFQTLYKTAGTYYKRADGSNDVKRNTGCQDELIALFLTAGFDRKVLNDWHKAIFSGK